MASFCLWQQNSQGRNLKKKKVDHHKDILRGEDCSACEKEQENHCQVHTFFFVFAINSATQSYCFVLYVFGLYLWIYLLNYLKLNVLSRIV